MFLQAANDQAEARGEPKAPADRAPPNDFPMPTQSQVAATTGLYSGHRVALARFSSPEKNAFKAALKALYPKFNDPEMKFKEHPTYKETKMDFKGKPMIFATPLLNLSNKQLTPQSLPFAVVQHTQAQLWFLVSLIRRHMSSAMRDARV